MQVRAHLTGRENTLMPAGPRSVSAFHIDTHTGTFAPSVAAGETFRACVVRVTRSRPPGEEVAHFAAQDA
jgi:hypothetical protein